MTDLVIKEDSIIERILTMELVRVTERAAVAAARAFASDICPASSMKSASRAWSN